MSLESAQQTDHAQVLPTEYAHFLSNEDGSYTPIKPVLSSETRITSLSMEARAAILTYASDTTGLDMGRIAASLAGFRATDKTMLFLRPAEYKAALEEVGVGSTDESGMYIESLGVAFIQRDPELEALNGTELTESFAIHEAAHSIRVPKPLRLIRSKATLWRSSSVHVNSTPRVYGIPSEKTFVPDFGLLFEEGYAELERGIFVQEHGLVEQFTKDARNLSDFKDSIFPQHYLYKNPSSEHNGESWVTFAPGIFGATIFEILMRQDEDLLPLLRKSRHKEEGIRETAELIDEIMPGLYEQLQTPDENIMAKVLVEVSKTFS